MKIVITGWSGYIAQNLEKALRKQEFSVVGLPRQLLYNMSGLIDFFDINKPDYIIHCASYGNYYDQQNDLETIYANIIATTNLLEMTRNIDYQGFINFSSSSVALPYETFYSATKAAGERIVRAFVNKYNKPIFSVRPYTVIGVGEQPEHLIPKLIHSCSTGTEMPFVKDATHDFIGVNDLCSAVINLMQYSDKLKGQVIEIGTGISTTNQQVLEIVEKITEKKANIKEVKSLRSYDSKNWVANPAVLEFLKWKPKQTLKQIIQDMVNAMIAGIR